MINMSTQTCFTWGAINNVDSTYHPVYKDGSDRSGCESLCPLGPGHIEQCKGADVDPDASQKRKHAYLHKHQKNDLKIFTFISIEQ